MVKLGRRLNKYQAAAHRHILLRSFLCVASRQFTQKRSPQYVRVSGALAPSLTMNKLSGKAAELTRQEWRDLGFYYISSTEQQKWILHGSKVGLLNLCKLVEEFAAKNHPLGEHDHLLPHWYLTLTSCDTFSINSRGISGTPKQLNEFAKIFTKSVQNSSKGTDVVNQIHTTQLSSFS